MQPSSSRQGAGPSHALDYRPDIDGLRAVAVIAVLFYHAWPNWFHSGFVGVDIFFVISGFLITTIIARQLEAGRFSIGDFYVRRIRRIFPALTLMLLVTLACAWALLLHDEFLQIGRHALAGAGFVSNLLLWHEAGYFDNAGTTKPLLHLWSLGVEEQFYIVWPLLLWAVYKLRARFLWVAGAIFVVSMTVNLHMVDSNPVGAFFSPVSRFWELMSGGVAAYLTLHHKERFTPYAHWLSLAGALLLALSFWLISPQALFPGYWALLPVGGSFLLVMAGPDGIVNRRLLGRRPMSAVGLVSYPLYLWHWPLLSFGFIVYGQKPPMLVKAALLAAACVLAALTYRLLELPLRALRARMRVTWSLAGSMVAIALLGLTIATGTLRERIDTHGAEAYLSALNDSDFPGRTLAPVRYQGIVFQKAASKAPGQTVFLGDSVMQQYGPRVEHAIATAPERYRSVIFATAGGCPPIEGTVRLPRLRFPLCTQTTTAAYALANSPATDAVVVGAAWYGYFAPSQHELLVQDGTNQLAFPDPRAQELAFNSLRASLAKLVANGKKVFLVLQPPAGAPLDPQSMYTGSRLGGIYPVQHIAPFDLNGYFARHAQARQRLLEIARATGATAIEPADTLCSDGKCPVLDATGVPLYTDSVHMRPRYARAAATFLDQTMLAAPHLQTARRAQ